MNLVIIAQRIIIFIIFSITYYNMSIRRYLYFMFVTFKSSVIKQVNNDPVRYLNYIIIVLTYKDIILKIQISIFSN